MDFLKDNPGAEIDEVRRVWARKRALPSDDGGMFIRGPIRTFELIVPRGFCNVCFYFMAVVVSDLSKTSDVGVLGMKCFSFCAAWVKNAAIPGLHYSNWERKLNDLVVFLASRLQGYFPLFFRIVAHPRTNIPTLSRQPSAVKDSMAFFGISLAIGIALQAPFLMEKNDFVVAAGILSLYKLIETILAAFALALIFRLLRGVGHFEPILAATLYITAPLYVPIVIVKLLTLGVLRDFDRALADEWRMTHDLSGGTIEAMWAIDAGNAAAVTAILLGQAVMIIIWLIICWSVFSQLNGFGRWRSIIGFCLGGLAFWGLGKLGFLILDGLFPDGIGGAL